MKDLPVMFSTHIFILLTLQSSWTRAEAAGNDCAACKQYLRKRDLYKQRRLLRRDGVPEDKLPKFTEINIKPEEDCLSCQQRLLPGRRYNARRYGLPKNARKPLYLP